MSDPGYRVPDGEALIEDMACQLVYYPDIPEYRTILLSQLLELTNWRNWERDDDHKGKDAATSWKAANVLTWECWRMACLEQLQADVSAILAYLQVSNPCCDDNITYGDGTSFTTDITPNSGDAPDYYGETAVTDWDDWKEHVCFNGNAWVDKLISESVSIENVLAVGGLTIGLLAYAIAGIALFVVGGFISGPVLIVIMSGIVAGYTSELFSDAAEDIEDNRGQILCALFNGTSVADAIEAAVSSLAWSIFYQHIDYDSAVALLYEGGDGTTFLPADTDDTCDFDCLYQIGDYLADFDFDDLDEHQFYKAGGAYMHAGGYWYMGTSTGHINVNSYRIRNWWSIPDTTGKKLWINRITCRFKHYNAGGGDCRVTVDHDGGTSTTDFPNDAPNWSEGVVTFSPALQVTSPSGTFAIDFSSVGSVSDWLLDDITVDLDIEL